MRRALINSRRSLILLLAIALPALTAWSQKSEPSSSSHFAKLDAMRVHYQAFGQGKEALIFVHGWTCNLNFWKTNAPALARQMRVIAIDLPGHGESDKPQMAYTMDLFAQAIEAVLRDAGVESAVLAGHSMGAPVIRQFYRKYPNKTRALIIVDGSLKPFDNPEAMKKLMGLLRGPVYQAAAGPMVEAMTRPMKDPAGREEAKAAMLATPQHVAVSAFEGMLAADIWQADQIKVPVLALYAKQPAWTPEYEQFVRGLIPNLDYQVWDGVSHFLMMDEPQKFNDAVASFLKKNKLVK
jgi:pimeloyl-ACP methyl ester carboxylesterase